MNIDEYLLLAPIVMFAIFIFIAYFSNINKSKNQIQWLKEQLANRDKTITDLNNRLMSKSFDQYKMYEQPIQEVVPPEPEEFFDEQAVGKITGEEIDADA